VYVIFLFPSHLAYNSTAAQLIGCSASLLTFEAVSKKQPPCASIKHRWEVKTYGDIPLAATSSQLNMQTSFCPALPETLLTHVLELSGSSQDAYPG